MTFPTRLHGTIDYVFAASLPAATRAAGARRPLRRLADGCALFVAAYSALTDYERGLVPLLPLKAHLAADAATCAALVSVPVAVGEERSLARAVAVAFGLAGSAVAATTALTHRR